MLIASNPHQFPWQIEVLVVLALVFVLSAVLGPTMIRWADRLRKGHDGDLNYKFSKNW